VYFPNIQDCKFILQHAQNGYHIELKQFIKTGTPHADTPAYRNDRENFEN
jgi:hypothetical protein